MPAKRLRKLLLAIAALLCLQLAATAQSSSAHTLSGTVSASSGALSGTTVTVRDSATQAVAGSATTDVAGHYAVTLTSGTYDVRFDPAPLSGYQASVTTSYAVTGDRTLNVALVNAGAVTLSGVIQDPDGNPLPGTAAILNSTNGTTGNAGTSTDADGHFSLAVVPGDFHFEIYHGAQPAFDIYNDVTITANRSITITVPWRTVTVHVQSPSGSPVGGVQVNASGNTPAISLATGFTQRTCCNNYTNNNQTTDANGNATLRLLDTSTNDPISLNPPNGTGYANSTVPFPASTGNTTMIVQLTASDASAPTVTCGAADGLWHAANVSIACTASDSGTGLANAADASFSLATNVPDGSETADGQTGTRSVCDNALNCRAAGPVGGNKVDRKPPSIAVAAPIANATFAKDQVVAADFSCTDGGSGLASCTGTSSLGAAIDTATTGAHTFTVTATDNVGNSSTKTITYAVAAPDTTAPSITCGAADAAWHTTDASVSCTASDGGSGLANGADASFTLTTAVPTGSATTTAQTGARQVCDSAGNCRTAGPIGPFKVDRAAPDASVAFSAGQAYALNAAATVSYDCADIGSGISTCAGDGPTGAVIDTSTAGVHTFHVTATDVAGNQTLRTASYVVSSSSSPTGPFTVAGTVTALTGPSAFLTGSTVTALAAGTSTAVATAGVDSGGGYALSLPPGSYDLRVTPPTGSTYRQSTATAIAVDGDTALDFVLFQGANGSGTNLTGVLRDLDGAALPGATVTVVGGPSTTTDGQGRFQLVTDDGNHALRLSRGQSGGDASFSLQTSQLAIAGDTGVTLTLPLHRLTVSVTDPASQAVAGAAVSIVAPVDDVTVAPGVTATALSGQSATATSSSSGAARMRILPTAGSPDNPVDFTDPDAAYQPTTFTLAATSADRAIDVTVQPVTTVHYTGTVRDAAGQPLSGIGVAIGTHGDTTNNQGTFSVQTRPGARTVAVSTGVATLTYPVTLASADLDQTLTVPLKQLTVHVTDARDGSSVPGASVHYAAPTNAYEITPGVTAAAASQAATATSNGSGNATMSILPTPGSSGNAVTFGGHGQFKDTTYSLPPLTASTGVDVAVQAYDSHLTGTLQDEAGHPLSGATVSIIGQTSDATDAAGHFSVYGTAGPHVLRLQPSSPAVTLEAPTTLSGTTNRTLTLPAKRVAFRVIDPSNAAVSGAQVRAQAPASDVALAAGMTATATGDQSATVSTDANGNATALLLPTPGSSASGGSRVTPPVASGLSQTPFALPAIAADTTIVLHFQTAGGFGPTVSCEQADGNWHPGNVAIHCTAQAPAGLANAADASFDLTTSVAAGSETSNAATGSRTVCDAAGACVTAPPVTGNQVDRKAATANIVTPTATSYAQGQTVNASYSCADGGSGVATCTGTVAGGSPIDTAAAGAHTFAVTATDKQGNASTSSVSYTVTATPSVSCPSGNTDNYCQAIAATSGLKNYWRFDGATQDLASHVAYSTAGASVSLVAGVGGANDKALRTVNPSFGAQLPYVSITPTVDMSGRKPWTIEFWWKQGTTINTTPMNVAFGFYNGSGSTGCTTAACMAFSPSASINSVLARGEYTLPPFGSFVIYEYAQYGWTHLAVTYDGNDVRLYKGGVLQRTLASTTSLPANPITRFLASNDATWDELAIYDRALGAGEVAQHAVAH
ncbi:MAG: Kelch repeat-containing protein [Conexibacter sp.]|nr:Kelch repeat-containing protein [Conexibacter sp.]